MVQDMLGARRPLPTSASLLTIYKILQCRAHVSRNARSLAEHMGSTLPSDDHAVALVSEQLKLLSAEADWWAEPLTVPSSECTDPVRTVSGGCCDKLRSQLPAIVYSQVFYHWFQHDKPQPFGLFNPITLSSSSTSSETSFLL